MATQRKFKPFGLLAWDVRGRRMPRESAVRAFVLAKRFTPFRALLAVLIALIPLIPPLGR